MVGGMEGGTDFTDSWVDAIQSGELVLEMGGPGEAALKIEIHGSSNRHHPRPTQLLR